MHLHGALKQVVHAYSLKDTVFVPGPSNHDMDGSVSYAI